MSGTSLTTKGVISSDSGGQEIEAAIAAPPSEPVFAESTSPIGRIVIIVPTAINIVLLASENITDNLRVRQVSSLALPSLYKRAYLIANVTDEIAVVKA